MREVRETSIRYTYDDLQSNPEDPTGRRDEIVDDRLVVKGEPAIRHQRVLGNLYSLMRQLCEEFGLGEVLVAPVAAKLAEDQVPLPDLVFISSECAGIRRIETRIPRIDVYDILMYQCLLTDVDHIWRQAECMAVQEPETNSVRFQARVEVTEGGEQGQIYAIALGNF